MLRMLEPSANCPMIAICLSVSSTLAITNFFNYCTPIITWMSSCFWGTILLMRKGRWIIGIVIAVGTIIFVAYEQHRTREKYEAKRQEACIALSRHPRTKVFLL